MDVHTQARASERREETSGAFARLRAHGFRWLYVLDALALFGSMVLVNLLRFGTDWPSVPIATHLVGFTAATAVFIVVFYFGGLYDRELRLGRRMWLTTVASLTAVGLLVCMLVILPTGRYPIPRGNLPLVGILVALLATGNRHLSRALWARRYGPPRVLLVGAPDDMNLAKEHLDESDRLAIVVGEITDVNDLVPTVSDRGASDVLLVSETSLADIYPEPLSTFEARRMGVYLRVTARDTLLGLRWVRQIAGMPFVTLRTHSLPRSKTVFKRFMELLLLLVLSPLLVVLLAGCALYVRIVAGKPVLFWQDRTGRDGEPFSMVKFRTMVPDAEATTGPVKATRDDDRIIPACRWLRRTRLDELPQIWNVVRGDMSVVGPRPERPDLTEEYERIIPGYARRHEIPPGITGLAQVRGRYHTDPGYKLGHDIQYLVNWSPVLDAQILAQTVWVIVARKD